MRFAVFIVLALAVLLPACDKDKAKDPVTATQPASAAGAGGTEVTTHPQVLYDPAVSPVEFTVYGIKIGDPESAIPAADRMGKPDESGWVGFRGRSNVFRIENGKVQNMSVTDPQVLAKLDMKSEAELTQKFGKDDKTQQFGPDDPSVPFFY